MSRPLRLHYRQCTDRVPNEPCICAALHAALRDGNDERPDGGLRDLASNRQMPDDARPNVTLGEIRAALRAEATRDEGLREAAQEMADAYRDIEGDVINGRTDKAYDALRAALASSPEPVPSGLVPGTHYGTGGNIIGAEPVPSEDGLDAARLENDIRELRGAQPGELARRLVERGWRSHV